MYRSLDANSIIDTAQQLYTRIGASFPASGLRQVCEELLTEARQAATTARWLAAPNVRIRVISVSIIIAMFVVAASTMLALNRRVELFSSVADFLQGVDAGVNELILISAATYFLLSWETRIKRKRALRAIHVLRSFAHIIDMHQLRKDPERLTPTTGHTPSAPAHAMTPLEITRYLDYCSEMLSIISKIAALYVQDFDDATTLAAVDEVEDLTGSLSQKMWQKIMILDRMIPVSVANTADATG
ncbi:MAG TPA: hypothetical protein VKB34_14250 [Povalibacter sp.]|nr:hypothetical protein [Povalibacter sp.]